MFKGLLHMLSAIASARESGTLLVSYLSLSLYIIARGLAMLCLGVV